MGWIPLDAVAPFMVWDMLDAALMSHVRNNVATDAAA
jgi:hypothetical protein